MLFDVNNHMLLVFKDNEGMANHRGTTDKRRREIGERLKTAHEHSRYKDLKQKEIAKRLGVKTQQSVSLWFRGERLPGADHLIDIADLFKISLDWLLLGKGDMRSGIIRGDTVYIGSWPESAQSVIKGMAEIYEDQESKSQK